MTEPGTWWYGRPRLDTGWPRWAARVAGWIHALSAAAATVAGVLLGLLALLTLALVVLRYSLNWSHTGLEELKWHLFGSAIMLGGAWCLARDGHVRMDLVYGRLPARARAAIDLACMLLIVLPFCALLVWYGSLNSFDSFQRGELSRDAGGLPHRFLIRATVPLGFALLALQAVAQALRNLLVLLLGTASEPDQP